MKNIKTNISILLLLTLSIPTIHTRGQNIGLPFMKIYPGARQAGMGGIFTGVGDDIYTIYSNPGGVGLIRRWQWSVAYNRWFADVYQADFTFLKQFRFLGSKKTALGFGLNYVGMPSWDATGGKADPVSANHLVATISFGQRLDWLSRYLALGVNFKSISSRLSTYSATAMAADAGILFRPDRFRLGRFGLSIFDYGIFTAGVALLNYGTGMQFDKNYSSLPLTLRGGVSFRAGSYRAWSLLIATDGVKVENRDWVFGIGGELWWKDIIGARVGYIINGKDLGDFSFGFGFRWGDVINSIFGLPSRFGDSFEINLAEAGYGEVLEPAYRAAISHYPIAPEPFHLQEPQIVESRVRGKSSQIELDWEDAYDPDPFDEVKYILLIDRDRSRLQRIVKSTEKDVEKFFQSSLRDSVMISELTSSSSYSTSVMEGGIYYWAVVAYDLGKHARLAKRGRENISEFVVSTPDLIVKKIEFDPTQWITVTPEQGDLIITVGNCGTNSTGAFDILVEDLFNDPELNRSVLMKKRIENLSPDQDTTIQIRWETEYNGIHSIRVALDPDSLILERDKDNNIKEEKFVSVPKGIVDSPDSLEVMSTGYDYIELPFVPEIYFDKNSAVIDSSYFSENDIALPTLRTLAERLKKNRSVVIEVMGSIDALSGEKDPALADDRAESVKSMLIDLDVAPSQIRIVRDHPDKILGLRPMPSDSLDAKWVMEQNRVVSFKVEQKYEAEIFGPYKISVDTTLSGGGIPFNAEIVSSGGIQSWRIKGRPGPFEATSPDIVSGNFISGKFNWDGMNLSGRLVPRNATYKYNLVLKDTIGRTFRTHTDSVFIEEKRTLRRWEMFGAAKFAKIEPVYQFYWDRMMDIAKQLIKNPDMRVRFEGHACAIGNQSINEQLSYRRAQNFTRAFKERVKQRYPSKYQIIWKRIDPPVGYGESRPLKIRLKGKGDVLFGDNNSPVGRYLNRRIMVLLYKEN